MPRLPVSPFRRALGALLLFLAAAASLPAAETRTRTLRFLPGRQGELGAWLVAGPFSRTVATLEGGLQGLQPAEGAAIGAGHRWELLSTGQSAVDLSGRLDPEVPERTIFYLYTTVTAKYEQDGYAFLVANGPCRLWTPAAARDGAWSAEHRQHLVNLQADFAPEPTPLLVRVEARDGRCIFTTLVGSFVDEEAQALRGAVVQLRGEDEAERRQAWLAERVTLSTPSGFLAAGAFRLRLRWERGAPLPRAGLSGRLRLETPDGEAFFSHPLPPRLTPAMLRRGVVYEGKLTEVPEAAEYRLRARLVDGGEAFGTLSRTLLPAGILADLDDRTARELAAAEEARGEACPLGRLLRLRIRALAEAGASAAEGVDAEALRALLNAWEQALTAFRAGEDPQAGRTGRFTGAYISEVDGSVQPFRCFIPAETAPPRDGWPLVVLYHGYVPSYTRAEWMEIHEDTAAALEAAGVAMLLPFGRSNTDFLSVGEVDVLDALRAVARRYPLDPRRLYLAGYSMGGSGVWTTLAHYPGLFAAARIWSGRTDYYFWHGLQREALPFYLRPLINADNPVDLAENLRGVPLRVTHPANDMLVKVGHTERMAARLRELGRQAPLEVRYPQEGTHWDYSRDLDAAETWEWLTQFRRPAAPPAVEVVAFTPKYGARAWLRIREIDRWTERARLRAEADTEAGLLRVTAAENVAAGAVNLAALPRSVAGRDHLAGGEERYSARLRLPDGSFTELMAGADGLATFRLTAAPAGTDLRKTPERCGPVKEAFNAPFLLVRGTVGSQEESDELAAMAARFGKEWEAFAKGTPRVKDDVDLTPDDIQAYNLVCFGSPESNRMLARVGGSLPLHWREDGGYGVGEAAVAGGSEPLGLVACHPNPEAPGRLLVVMDGLFYGTFLPPNHKWDLVPDYLVFVERRGPQDVNRARLAGFFDSSWRYDPALQYPPPER